MKSSIIIIKGDGSKDYALERVQGYTTLVLLTELEYLRKYRGGNRNIQVGNPYRGLNVDLLLRHERIIVEPYNTEDFAAFMYENTLLRNFLKSEDRKMYVVMGNIKASIEGNKELRTMEWKEKGMEMTRFML